MAAEKESRAGAMAPGWEKHTLQVPRDLKRRYGEELKKRGHSGGKITGSVALAIFLGLPEDMRTLLYIWGVQQVFDDPNRLTPEAAREAFARIAQVCAEQTSRDRSNAESEPGGRTQPAFERWLTLILDPEFDWSKLDMPSGRPKASPEPEGEQDKGKKRKRA